MKSIRRRVQKYHVLSIALVVGVAACASEPRLPRLAGDAVIVAFGNSLTFGTGADLMESYPAVLERMIGRRVVNAGVPGEISSVGLSRLPEVLEREKPALLILCHGGNDILQRLNLQHTAENIRKMVLMARQRGIPTVLIAVPFPGMILSPAPMYREIAKELSLPLEEKTLSKVLADSSLKSDYIHPNAAGYRRLAESVATLLKKSGAIE